MSDDDGRRRRPIRLGDRVRHRKFAGYGEAEIVGRAARRSWYFVDFPGAARSSRPGVGWTYARSHLAIVSRAGRSTSDRLAKK